MSEEGRQMTQEEIAYASVRIALEKSLRVQATLSLALFQMQDLFNTGALMDSQRRGVEMLGVIEDVEGGEEPPDSDKV